MVLSMKNFNILGVHWKIQLLGEFEKNQYREGDCLKRGAWTVCWFKGVLARKSGWCFWGGGGGDNPMHTMLSYGWLQDSLQDPEKPKFAAVDFL